MDTETAAMINLLKEQGNKAYEIHNYGKAIDTYTEAIQLDDRNHVLYSNRSAAYVKTGKYEQALQDANKTIELNSTWVKGYLQKGSALYFMQKYGEALSAYAEGLKQDPTNAALLKRSAEYMQSMFSNYMDVDPNSPQLMSVPTQARNWKFEHEAAKQNYEREIAHLHEMLKEKDRLADSQTQLILVNDEVRAYLETDLLAMRHKLHCRGVLERFEGLYRFYGARSQSTKPNRKQLWVTMMQHHSDLKDTLRQANGFPNNIPKANTETVIANLVSIFYARLSTQIHMEESSQNACVIYVDRCSEWEQSLMIAICNKIPVRFRIVD